LTFAARALTAGRISEWPSPCGPDCTYNQSFFGPSFSCSPAYSNETGSAVTRWSADLQPGDTYDTLSLQWLSSLDGPTQSFSTCLSYNSTYDITVRFSGGIQHLDIQHITLHSTFGTSDPLSNWATPPGNGAGNPDGEVDYVLHEPKELICLSSIYIRICFTSSYQRLGSPRCQRRCFLLKSDWHPSHPNPRVV
jgi:hypothetical protein